LQNWFFSTTAIHMQRSSLLEPEQDLAAALAQASLRFIDWWPKTELSLCTKHPFFVQKTQKTFLFVLQPCRPYGYPFARAPDPSFHWEMRPLRPSRHERH
jgi:hypothetical protein